MRASTRRLITLFLTLLFLIGSVVMYSVGVKKAYQNVQRLRGSLDSKVAASERQSTINMKINQALSKYKDTPTKLQERVSMALPNKDDVAFLLYQVILLSRLTTQREDPQLTLKSFNVGAGGKVAGLSDQENGGAPDLKSVQISLNVSGTYDGIRALLNKLETNIRVMDVVKLDIQQASPKDPKNFFNANLTIRSYYQAN